MNEIIALFICAAIGLLLYLLKNPKQTLNTFVPLFLLQAMDQLQIGNLKIFLTFLKVGAILYGSGYVLFAFLDAELVANGWLTRQELIDAVAVGQFTPGPILSTATFVGRQMNGIYGALVATLGIFLPSFLFVYIFNPLIPRIRKSRLFSAFLDAANIAAVALIIAICIEMGRDTLTDWKTILIALISIGVVFRFKKVNSAFIVLGGALLGFTFSLIQ